MELLLWRHAEAEDGFPDASRQLTEKGRKQARQVARWLQPRLPRKIRILVSPATRTQQTAKALDLPFETVEAIGPGADARDILRAAGWPDAAHPLLVVGHQPTLGETAALVLTGEALPWPIKKGALWWLESRARDGASGAVLRAVVGPDLV